ncbi:hypothetical protein [Enterococcus casseliflavus]|uniref:hypothetical protein n=1 Tax=Enterococcus casseliflavus TaxID=37734 RepID=UPI0039A483B7
MRHDVELRTFDTVVDYYNNTFIQSNLKVTRDDLIRYAISVGEFSNFTLSSEGNAFYKSLVEMAFVSSGNKFIIGNSYKNAESTVKTSIGFIIGMISAKCVAEKVFGIRYLFHLKDPQIEYLTDGFLPDFFGLDQNGVPYIVEAKATYENRVTKPRVEKGKKQTESVKKIKLEDDNGVRLYNNFERHVVTSSFKDNEYILGDIDPNEKNGSKKVYIYENLAYFNYYKSIYNYLSSNSNSYESKDTFKFNQLKFEVVNTEIGNIGLETSIYSVLKEYDTVFSKCNSFENRWLFNKDELLFLKDTQIPNQYYVTEKNFKGNNRSNVDSELIEKKLKSISGLSSKIKKLDNFNEFKSVIKNNEKISLGYDGIIYFKG